MVFCSAKSGFVLESRQQSWGATKQNNQYKLHTLHGRAASFKFNHFQRKVVLSAILFSELKVCQALLRPKSISNGMDPLSKTMVITLLKDVLGRLQLHYGC
jgi:hypothetical protein